jgi:hypothetical protein
MSTWRQNARVWLRGDPKRGDMRNHEAAAEQTHACTPRERGRNATSQSHYTEPFFLLSTEMTSISGANISDFEISRFLVREMSES